MTEQNARPGQQVLRAGIQRRGQPESIYRQRLPAADQTDKADAFGYLDPPPSRGARSCGFNVRSVEG